MPPAAAAPESESDRGLLPLVNVLAVRGRADRRRSVDNEVEVELKAALLATHIAITLVINENTEADRLLALRSVS
jgi:hypothetical protein